jgi:hypothetical protein
MYDDPIGEAPDLPPPYNYEGLGNFLGELGEVTDILGPYVLPAVGAAVLGVGVGVAIDALCPLCAQAAGNVGGAIYQATHPYDPNIPTTGYATNPNPSPSSVDPFSIQNSYFPPSSSCSQ